MKTTPLKQLKKPKFKPALILPHVSKFVKYQRKYAVWVLNRIGSRNNFFYS